MLKNYIKIAFRTSKRQSGYALLNVLGLALGLACCLFIFFFVRHETTYDQFHKKADRIVRVTFSTSLGTYGVTPALMAPILQEHLPQVEAFARFDQAGGAVIQREDGTLFKEKRVYFADSTAFKVFSFGLVRGNPQTALREPNSVVLSQAAADRYFPGEDPMGQTFRFNNEYDLRVTGVLDTVPSNSSLQFDLLVSFGTYGPETDEQPWQYQVSTFLLLNDPASLATLDEDIQRVGEEQLRGQFWIDDMIFGVERLPDIHFYSEAFTDLGAGDIRYVYIFSAIALLVLLIACVNYMNMATARFSRRTKEVGVRKVLGAQRSQVARQFLVESLLTVGAAFLLALALTEVAQPFFETLTGQPLKTGLANAPLLLLGIVGATMLTGVLAGAYPALFLSRFRPVHALKGGLPGTKRGGAGLRRVLVVMQFTITIALIISALTIYQQLQYVREARMGFETEHVVSIPLRESKTQYETVKAEMLKIPGVLHASVAMDMPLGGFTSEAEIGGERITVRSLPVDHDFVETMGLDVIEGRNFSRDFASDDTAAVLINETLARLLQANPGQADDTFETKQVVGVLQDFNTSSLHHPLAPAYLQLWPKDFYHTLLLRIAPENRAATLSDIEQVWKTFVPNRPFEYTFLDNRIDQLYQDDLQMGRLFNVFALLAISIACLGLFGMAAYAAESRTKEIGIRKVLGASVHRLVGLLTSEFVVLVLIASALAAVPAYLAMQRWLDDFAYRIELSWPTFLIAGLMALAMTLLTVSYQSIRAAMADPVRSLRYE